MDLTKIVDDLCRAWSPEYDEPRAVKDDLTLTGMSPAERRELRSRMRRLAKRAVLPLLQASRPMDPTTGRFIERRETNPLLQAHFQRLHTVAGGYMDRRKNVSFE